MKKFITSGILSTILLAQIATAGGPDIPPPNHGRFIVGGTYGLFQQSNIGTQYGVLSNVAANPEGEIIDINTKYYSGWGVQAGYLFSNDNDILFSNLIFWGANNGNISSGMGQAVFASAAPAGPANRVSAAYSLYDYRTELYQLAFAHHFHLLHDALMIHPFIGAGLGKARESQQTTYLALLGVDGNDILMSQVNSFNGMGPSLGLDVSWHIWRWFYVVGNASWTGVIAKLKQNLLASTTGNANYYDTYNTSNSTVFNIVTFKAGFSTLFPIKEEDIAVTLGYRATNIINGSANLVWNQGGEQVVRETISTIILKI